MEQQVMEALRAHFKPEFLNRIDDIILFHGLSLDQIKQIIEIQLRLLKKRLQEQNIDITLTDAAKNSLAQKGYDSIYGARPLKRAIQKYILDELALKLLEGAFDEETHIIIDAPPGQDKFTFTALARRAA